MLYDQSRPDQDDLFGRLLAAMLVRCKIHEVQ